MISRKNSFIWGILLLALSLFGAARADEKGGDRALKFSPQTQACIGCHSKVTPGIVEDWLTSRHSTTSPENALKKKPLERRISAADVPQDLMAYAVGCYECHSRNPEKHRDNFQHMGYRINVVVSPKDCEACHPVEAQQYASSKKANAWKNIINNPVYHSFASSTTGLKDVRNGKIAAQDPSPQTLQDTCFGCHGAKVEVRGMKKVYSGSAWGEIEVPDLTNWPNQGVGRENPDNSIGSCTSCHPRHSFSIKVARKPYTCGQCHLEPDVPAFNVYKESKHGNLFSTFESEWNFDNVPWTLGKDIKAPTCAACHNSLLVAPDGAVIAERSHDFGARVWKRIFGLIYAHPQPQSGDTTIIRNKDGLPLPTSFLNEPASEFLISPAEQERRYTAMKSVCRGCHGTQWITSHFDKFEHTVNETNEMTLAATKLMMEAWDKGLEDRSNLFDEPIEKLWVRQWFFYANSIRFASAMTGAHDYATFKNGWWELSETLLKMRDLIDLKEQTRSRQPQEKK